MASPREVKSNQRAPKPASGAVSGGGAAVAEEKKGRTPPLRISEELMSNAVFPQLDTKSLAAFAKSSFYAHKQAQPMLDQRAQIAIEKLFTHVLNGNLTEVKKMLDMNPGLALVRRMPGNQKEAIIRNKAGQCIAVGGKTGYMLALGEEDTEIAAMFKTAIMKVADEKEVLAQYKAQLPDGWEKAEEKRWAPVFEKTKAAFQAAIDFKPGDVMSSAGYKLTVRAGSKIDQALTMLAKSHEDILNEPVITGRHFNPNLAQGVFQAYDCILEKLFRDMRVDHPSLLVCWQRIAGSTERLFPANYMQAACDGFYSTAEKLKKGTPQARSFRLKVYNHSTLTCDEWVDDVSSPAVAGVPTLGVDYAIDCRRGIPLRGSTGGEVAPQRTGMLFRSLCQSKTACLQNLCDSTEIVDLSRQNRLAQ